ncbi:MAG: hypothetical protein O7I42_06585, partial [Alphaproteobacteria bacterium]|nr:hypothetical protein [Alphaproteobacteria bacterium]
MDMLKQLLSGDQATLTLGLIFVAVMLAVLDTGALFARNPLSRRLSGDAPARETKRRGDDDTPMLRANIE